MEALSLLSWPPWAATKRIDNQEADGSNSDNESTSKCESQKGSIARLLSLSSSSDHRHNAKRTQSGGIENLKIYEEIPDWLRNNHFIRNGYLVHCSAHECLLSVLQWHNETINIWTHLIGFFVLLAILINDIVYRLPFIEATERDKNICILITATYSFTLLLSATYHTFKCMHEKAYYLLLKADVVGIGLSLSATIMSGTYYAFYWNSFWQQFYLSCEFLILSTIYATTFHPIMGLPKYESRRNILIALYVAFALVPATHWALTTGLESTVVRFFLPRVVMCFVYAGLALVVFARRFPECLYPGTMDCLGASHQIWHVFVILAKIWWHETGFMCFDDI